MKHEPQQRCLIKDPCWGSQAHRQPTNHAKTYATINKWLACNFFACFGALNAPSRLTPGFYQLSSNEGAVLIAADQLHRQWLIRFVSLTPNHEVDLRQAIGVCHGSFDTIPIALVNLFFRR